MILLLIAACLAIQGDPLARAESLYRAARTDDEYREAQEAYAKAIAAAPEKAGAWRGHAETSARLGDWAQAYASRCRAVELDPGPNLPDRAASLSLKDWDRVRRDYDRAIDLELKAGKVPSYSTLDKRQQLLTSMGEYAKALADCDLILGQTSLIEVQVQSARWARTFLLDKLGRTAEAESELAVILEKAAPHHLHYWRRGEYRLKLGQAGAAITDFDKALELKPGHALSLVGRAEAKAAKGDPSGAASDFAAAVAGDATLAADASMRQARLLERSGDLAGALAAIDAALKHADAQSRPDCLRARARVSKAKDPALPWHKDLRAADEAEAETLIANHAYKLSWWRLGALADLDRAVTVDTLSVKALFHRARLKTTLGDLDGAIADYGAAIALEAKIPLPPAERPGLYSGRAEARMAKEDWKGAVEDFAAARQKSEGQAFARALEIVAQGRLDGDMDGAQKKLEEKEAHANRHMFHRERHELGKLLLAKGDPKALIRLLAVAKEQPDNAEYAFYAALARKASKADASAVEAFSRALKLAPLHARSYFERGLVRKALADPLAAGDFAAARDLDASLVEPR